MHDAVFSDCSQATQVPSNRTGEACLDLQNSKASEGAPSAHLWLSASASPLLNSGRAFPPLS